ncbi:MAG TPA: DNA polymerase III subunit alpha, partial [Sediminispirochaeta sp.]|nr:DNA polymerase III subunit alpha [Sediminispirochaeta sp.]
LKANYPAEFMAANLTNEINDSDKLAIYIAETKSMGLEILPPDVNLSQEAFSVSEGKIIYGLVGIKNVGKAAVEEILRAREEEGAYTSLEDFLYKVDLRAVNRKVVETLIQSGAFDRFGHSRAELMHNLDRLLAYVQKRKEQEKYGQTSLFDAGSEEELQGFEYEEQEEWTAAERLMYEKTLLGFYVSGHPLDKYRQVWERAVRLDLSKPERFTAKSNQSLLGVVNTVRTIYTKKGQSMAFLQLEDFNGSIELVVFPKLWEPMSDRIEVDSIIACYGKLDTSRGDPKFLVDSFVTPEELQEVEAREVHIRLERNTVTEEELYNLRSFLFDHKGTCPLYLHLNARNGHRETIIRASSQITLSSSREVLDELKAYPTIEDVWTA